MKAQFVSTAPQTLPTSIPAAAGIKAFYFRDPDGHNLELISSPPAKAIRAGSSLTTICFWGSITLPSVSPAPPRAWKFYRDLLGMRKAGESENFGNEQEHLNQVFGAHLQITGMRANQGPGIEFLEYLTPRDGRPIPEGKKSNDIMHWQTTIATDDLAATVQKFRQNHVGFVSSRVIVVPKEKLGFSKGVLVSDPDGHDVLLVEK